MPVNAHALMTESHLLLLDEPSEELASLILEPIGRINRQL